MRNHPTIICSLAFALAHPAGFAEAQAPVVPTEPSTSTAHLTNVPDSVVRMMENATKIAPHVWVFHAPMSSGIAPLANTLLIEQRDGLILVDAGKTRGAGARLVTLIHSIGSKPVKAVILTHWHQDHVLGLGPVLEAWPGIPVIANQYTATAIATDSSYAGAPTSLVQTAARNAQRTTTLRNYVKDYIEKVRDPKMTPRQHQGWVDVLGVIDQRISDEQGTYLVHPTQIFKDRLRIEDPDAPVEAIEIGQGHTNADVVVWLPKQRVLAAGDLVVWPVPYGGSKVLEWPTALERMIDLHPQIVVPGHGDVLHGTSYLQAMVGAIESIITKARALVAANPNLTDDEVRAKADLGQERRMLTRGDAWLNDLFNQNFADDIVVAYRQLTAK